MWAIVPVKPFMRAKSRLAAILSPRERAGLSREFLDHALEVLAQVPSIQRTLVISRDSQVLAVARERGAHTVTESGAPDLNAALTRATEAAVQFGAPAVLILPADLPLLTPADVEQMTRAEGDEALVVIVPDRHEKGTNALFVRPPGLIKYAFGPNSFQEHVRRARTACARVKVCRLPGPALDVDLPEDFQLYQTAAAATPRSHKGTKT